MKTPVIIPAFNEERNIEKTLRRLPASKIEPIVAVNGSCDQTATIAERFGAKVFSEPEQGKLPAVQKVLAALGERALDPLIILDADTRPFFPKKWHDRMLRSLSIENTPICIGGPILYSGHPLTETAIRSAWRAGRAVMSDNDKTLDRAGQFGPNMGLKLDRKKVLKDVLELPHLWPGEDRALGQVVVDNNGVYRQPVHPYLFASTPTSPSLVSLSERRRLGLDESRRANTKLYTDRAAPGSTPYINY